MIRRHRASENTRDSRSVKKSKDRKSEKSSTYKRQRHPWIQWFVVATSFFPFKQIYIAIYKAVIWFVARQLYKDPFVAAVYLRHGCARDEIVPGISDIDLAMIVRDDGSLPKDAHFDSRKLQMYKQRYKRLVRHIPLLDSYIFILLDTRLEEKYLTGHQDRYILMEGRANWRLLRGENYLSSLPELPDKIRHGGMALT